MAAPGCPSLLDLARCEAGDLPHAVDAMQAHASGCSRCGGIASVIGCARLALLGPTPHERCVSSHRAATMLAAVVEGRRLSHC
jgi:hypothetical protein